MSEGMELLVLRYATAALGAGLMGLLWKNFCDQSANSTTGKTPTGKTAAGGCCGSSSEKPLPEVPRVHMHLKVSNVSRSVEFYSKLFGCAPVKHEIGYAKFLPPWAPINLAMSDLSFKDNSLFQGAREYSETDDSKQNKTKKIKEALVNHAGLQVESKEIVLKHLERVKKAGLEVVEEMGIGCCYAIQDKFWVNDPDGAQWEVYFLNHDTGEAAPCCG
eukprot:gb/GEZN01010747.1/.p1 GENE.gb/GEZN01010747.1/~~gb/GEZN01010747.1/.p1  ORF type:complete len:218 (-),score=34.06 gb/GEZN01010747.1/:532-1185(-)